MNPTSMSSILMRLNASNEPKASPQRSAEEDALELEALANKIDGFNE